MNLEVGILFLFLLQCATLAWIWLVHQHQQEHDAVILDALNNLNDIKRKVESYGSIQRL